MKALADSLSSLSRPCDRERENIELRVRFENQMRAERQQQCQLPENSCCSSASAGGMLLFSSTP